MTGCARACVRACVCACVRARSSMRACTSRCVCHVVCLTLLHDCCFRLLTNARVLLLSAGTAQKLSTMRSALARPAAVQRLRQVAPMGLVVVVVVVVTRQALLVNACGRSTWTTRPVSPTGRPTTARQRGTIRTRLDVASEANERKRAHRIASHRIASHRIGRVAPCRVASRQLASLHAGSLAVAFVLHHRCD